MMIGPQQEKTPTRLGTYKSYLLFKHMIDIIREKPSSRHDIAEKMGINVGATWHTMRVLVKHNVIKIDHYDMSHSSKRAVYKLIKDE